jgi:hypothetical protein
MQATVRVRTSRKYDVVDVTRHVGEIVARARLAEGLCTVFVRHATAAIVINENADAGVRADIVAALDKLFPEGVWEHDRSTTTAPPTSRPRFSAPRNRSPFATGGSSSGPGRVSRWSSATGRAIERS